MAKDCASISTNEVKVQYQNSRAVERYSGYFKDSPRIRRKDRREKRSIAQGLAQVPQGAWVLDLPCGAGRMYELLKDLGYSVVSADSSAQMVDYAREAHHEIMDSSDLFQVADIFQTGFKDKQFDAVVCNRLFHHFSAPETRIKALVELKRICSGPIVVSFFSNAATDALKYYFKKHVRGKVIKDRIPISPARFAREIRTSGLQVKRWILPRPGISMHWYVVLNTSA